MKSKLLDAIGSDQRILANTRKEGNIWIFDLPGLTVRGQVPSKVDMSVVTQWCNHVRAMYKDKYEIESREVSEEDEPRADVQGAYGGNVASPERRDGPTAAVPTSAAEAKAAVEEYLRAQVADAEARATAAKEESDAHRAKAARLLSEYSSWLAVAERLREALNAPQVRNKNRRPDQAAQVRRQVSGRAVAAVDRGPVAADDTRGYGSGEGRADSDGG